MIQEGDTAPGFRLPGSDGEEIKTYHLDDYTDTGAVVLSFYPFDFSPVCVDQLCTFRDVEWLSFSENVDVFGVSTDSAYAHKEFINKYDLNFPLLSDHSSSVSEQYGVRYDLWEEHERVSKRALFLIDDSNTVRYKWVTEDALESPPLDGIRDSLESIGKFTV